MARASSRTSDTPIMATRTNGWASFRFFAEIFDERARRGGASVNARENLVCFYAAIFTISAYAAAEQVRQTRRNALMEDDILLSP